MLKRLKDLSMRDKLLEEVISRRGGGKMIAKACGVSQSAVSQWKKVPKKHAIGFSNAVAQILQKPPTQEARS
ncbi:Cro/CI family transcriptional regulator [Acetobacter pomorum]|uniref:Cro/CI family transcriptional regulator n=2 Tax=Acetobacter pomorum TaxID=65959 RepID=UPI0038D0B5A2